MARGCGAGRGGTVAISGRIFLAPAAGLGLSSARYHDKIREGYHGGADRIAHGRGIAGPGQRLQQVGLAKPDAS